MDPKKQTSFLVRLGRKMSRQTNIAELRTVGHIVSNREACILAMKPFTGSLVAVALRMCSVLTAAKNIAWRQDCHGLPKKWNQK